MAFPEDVFPPDECCEICGVRLDDEVVIQEFADGSLARLCPECAAGAAFDPEPRPQSDPAAVPEPDGSTTPPLFPDSAPDSAASIFPDPVENDPMEMTKELLMPVTDLISLQTEMQAALERLAGSLERFATGVISDSIDKSVEVDTRIRSLENELERTRARLREAESLLVATSTAVDVPTPEAASMPSTGTGAIPGAPSAFPVEPMPDDAAESREAKAEAEPPAFFAAATTASDEGWEIPATEPAPPGAEAEAVGAELPAAPRAAGEIPAGHGEVFSLDEIRWAQRFFNESPFIERIRDVRRSLGRPKASLSRVAGTEPRVLVTVIWDIVWYQYVVNLRQDAPTDERVALFREGMDLEELLPHFREKNASIDDDGRLDASELEVRLLSDPTVLITEMSPDEEQALEDATEEIWDQRISPEFKWDD